MITLDTARKRLGDARGFLHIDERESELEELETQIAAADFSRVLRRCSIRSRSNPGSMVLMTILAQSLRSILVVGD